MAQRFKTTTSKKDSPFNKNEEQSTTLQVTIIDVILSEWLSTAHSSLVPPVLAVVSMCKQSTITDGRQCLQVEAFGSGVLILPCFEFDSNTNSTTLFNAVGKKLPDIRIFLLRCGESEITRGKPLSEFAAVQDGSVVSVVTVDTSFALYTRKLIVVDFVLFFRGHATNFALCGMQH